MIINVQEASSNDFPPIVKIGLYGREYVSSIAKNEA
jgi:hypothetical protein